MQASRHFGMTRIDQDDWFDALLNTDTKLFIDPFLIFLDRDPVWVNAHRRIIGHFDVVFQLIAESQFNRQSLAYRKAIDLLTFREPKELCLGYTARGTRGSGGGRGHARAIAEAIEAAIRRGLTHPRHFEELGILNERIGSDIISDITATILKPELITYTQSIAQRHQLPVASHRLYAARFDEQRRRFLNVPVDVPTNPFTERPFLFVPERFIRELPTLNADDWFTSYENQQIRDDVNFEVMRNVRKADIVRIARAHPEAVRTWTEQMERAAAATPYDVESDPEGVYQWQPKTRAFALAHPIELPAATSGTDFLAVIERLVVTFKHFVEQQGGWQLLWNDGGKDKKEEAAQLLFRGIVQSYCEANNISLDREVEVGRGPVDFQFSNGYRNRALLEIKKLQNGKFWNGLEVQLPTYMRSAQVAVGWFIAIRYRSNKQADRRVLELPARVAALREKERLDIRHAPVDARRPVSASRL